MKGKAKSSKNIAAPEHKKSQKKLNQSKLAKSVSKNNESQVRRNLESTFKLLQARLNIKQQVHTGSLLGLSQSIYDIVQKNIPERPKIACLPTQDSSSQSSSLTAQAKDRPRSYSSHSSSIMEYFKDKFGDNPVDEKAIQKKLKALQALKKSQELAQKYNSQYNMSTCSIPDYSCDTNTKQLVVGKLKKRSNE